MISIQPSTEKDAVKLSRNMRKQDIMEVEAVDTDPLSALLYPVRHESAQTFTLFYDKEPVLMGGTVGESIGLARVWLLASDKAFQKPMKLKQIRSLEEKILAFRLMISSPIYQRLMKKYQKLHQIL